MVKLPKKSLLLIIWICLCSVVFVVFTTFAIVGTVNTLRHGLSAEGIIFNLLGLFAMSFPYASFMVLAVKKLRNNDKPPAE